MIGPKIIRCFSQLTDISNKIANSDHISLWKAKRLSDESITPPDASSNRLALDYINTISRVQFYGRHLEQYRVTLTRKKVLIIYNVYEINLQSFNVGKGFGLGNSLFVAFELTKNAEYCCLCIQSWIVYQQLRQMLYQQMSQVLCP